MSHCCSSPSNINNSASDACAFLQETMAKHPLARSKILIYTHALQQAEESEKRRALILKASNVFEPTIGRTVFDLEHQLLALEASSSPQGCTQASPRVQEEIQALASEDNVQPIVRKMQQHELQFEPVFQQAAASRLRALLTVSTHDTLSKQKASYLNRFRFVHCDGLAVLLQSLRMYTAFQRLQRDGLVILANVAYQPSKSWLILQEQMARFGMEDDALVSCAAQGARQHGDDSSPDETILRLLTDVGAWDVIGQAVVHNRIGCTEGCVQGSSEVEQFAHDLAINQIPLFCCNKLATKGTGHDLRFLRMCLATLMPEECLSSENLLSSLHGGSSKSTAATIDLKYEDDEEAMLAVLL